MNFRLMIEETLQRMDAFFKEKSQKDTYMVYIMIIVILCADIAIRNHGGKNNQTMSDALIKSKIR